MRVNVRSLYLFTQAVTPVMKTNGGGSIVNISSGAAAHEVSALMPPGYVIYSVAKAALERFSSAAAPELRPLGININALRPGAVKTEHTARGVRPRLRLDGLDDARGCRPAGRVSRRGRSTPISPARCSTFPASAGRGAYETGPLARGRCRARGAGRVFFVVFFVEATAGGSAGHRVVGADAGGFEDRDGECRGAPDHRGLRRVGRVVADRSRELPGRCATTSGRHVVQRGRHRAVGLSLQHRWRGEGRDHSRPRAAAVSGG